VLRYRKQGCRLVQCWNKRRTQIKLSHLHRPSLCENKITKDQSVSPDGGDNLQQRGVALNSCATYLRDMNTSSATK
jgi:hypothetical protein